MSQPMRVLFVEDSEDDTLLMLRALQREGFAATHARVDTPEALRAALNGEPFDVALIDYVMPGLTTLEALEVLSHDLRFTLVGGAQ